jgi:hypothetical protein
MSALRIGWVGALLLATMVAGCGPNDAPVGPAEPTLAASGIYPTSGLVSGGTEVAVGGAGFQEGTTVTFGGLAARHVRLINSRAMYVIAPAHAAGDVEVVVTNPDGRSANSPTRYRYVDMPEGPGPWDY